MPQVSQVTQRQGAPEITGRAVEIDLAGKLVDAPRVIEEPRHLGLRPESGILVDHRAIRPEIAAGRIETDKFEMVLQAFPGSGEKITQNVRHGQQGRPHAPAKIIYAQLLDLAA